MQDRTIFKISSKIKEIRKQKGITIQALANQAGVSKGLISQIENNRTVPSLLVLINIINSLQIDLDEFFEDFKGAREQGIVLVIKKDEYSHFENEQHSIGFDYQRILNSNIESHNVDIVLLQVAPKVENTAIKSDAFVFQYAIQGQIEYIFADRTIQLEEGDSLIFNSRSAYATKNVSSEKCLLLMVNFIKNN